MTTSFNIGYGFLPRALHGKRSLLKAVYWKIQKKPLRNRIKPEDLKGSTESTVPLFSYYFLSSSATISMSLRVAFITEAIFMAESFSESSSTGVSHPWQIFRPFM
jgi:hypothetical protein